MKRKSKVLGAVLLSTFLVMGSSIVALANSDSTTVGGAKVSYGSQVTSSSGTAFTNCSDSSASLSVSATYYFHDSFTFTEHFDSDSKTGRVNVTLNFTCSQGNTTSYIYATHDATVGNYTMDTKTTTAVYIPSEE